MFQQYLVRYNKTNSLLPLVNTFTSGKGEILNLDTVSFTERLVHTHECDPKIQVRGGLTLQIQR